MKLQYNIYNYILQRSPLKYWNILFQYFNVFFTLSSWNYVLDAVWIYP